MKTLKIEIFEPSFGEGKNFIFTNQDGQYIQQFFIEHDLLQKDIIRLCYNLADEFGFNVKKIGE